MTHAMQAKAILESACRTVLFLCMLPLPSAHGSEWILSLKERHAERKKESWYFNEHVAAKGASGQQDLWYRLFLGQRDKRPRLELEAGGLGQAVRQELGRGDSQVGLTRTALGYEARLAFNHFVSSFTGIKTLNMVPFASAEVLDSSFELDRTEFVTNSNLDARTDSVGGGFRLLGQNPGDTAIFLDYSRRRLVVPQAGLGAADRLLDRRTFEGWVPKLGLQFYLFPVFALSGEVAVAEDLVMPHVSDGSLQLFEHSYGGHLDLAMFRLRYDYTERALIPRPGAQRALRSMEVIHQIGIGVVF